MLGQHSPFLTAQAAARQLGLSPRAAMRRLSAGSLPGYRLGRHWFVPAPELSLHQGATGRVEPTTISEAVHEIVAPLPAVVDLADMEAFFGTHRPHLYEILRIPSLGVRRGGSRVTTQALLAAALVQARNGCPPLRYAAAAPWRRVIPGPGAAIRAAG